MRLTRRSISSTIAVTPANSRPANDREHRRPYAEPATREPDQDRELRVAEPHAARRREHDQEVERAAAEPAQHRDAEPREVAGRREDDQRAGQRGQDQPIRQPMYGDVDQRQHDRDQRRPEQPDRGDRRPRSARRAPPASPAPSSSTTATGGPTGVEQCRHRPVGAGRSPSRPQPDRTSDAIAARDTTSATARRIATAWWNTAARTVAAGGAADDQGGDDPHPQQAGHPCMNRRCRCDVRKRAARVRSDRVGYWRWC